MSIEKNKSIFTLPPIDTSKIEKNLDLLIQKHYSNLLKLLHLYNKRFCKHSGTFIQFSSSLENSNFLFSGVEKLDIKVNFSEYFSPNDIEIWSSQIAVFAVRKRILDCFTDDIPMSKQHKQFIDLIFSPLLSRTEYDLKLTDLNDLYNGINEFSFVFSDQEFREIVLAIIWDTTQFLSEDDTNTYMPIFMSTLNFKKKYCCGNMKRLETISKSTYSDQENTTLLKSHLEVYASHYYYPSQYYVFLGLALKLLLVKADPNKYSHRVDTIIFTLLRYAYKCKYKRNKNSSISNT